MGIAVEWQGGPVVLTVAGHRIVGSRRALRQHVEDALHAGARRVVVDVGAAGAVDTAGLGTLVLLARRVRAAGGELHVAHLPAGVAALLASGALEAIFHLDEIDTIDEVEGCGSGARASAGRPPRGRSPGMSRAAPGGQGTT